MAYTDGHCGPSVWGLGFSDIGYAPMGFRPYQGMIGGYSLVEGGNSTPHPPPSRVQALAFLLKGEAELPYHILGFKSLWLAFF